MSHSDHEQCQEVRKNWVDVQSHLEKSSKEMHLQSMLLSQVDGISSDEDAQKFHSTKETLSI